MSPLLVAVLALAAPPSDGALQAAPPRAAVSVEKSVEKAGPSPRTGAKLREAVRTALRRWSRPSDAQSDEAAREFLTLYKELQADDQLSRSGRGYYLQKVRGRLMRLSDQITLRVAREKRLAKSRRAKAVEPAAGKSRSLGGSQQAAGGSAGEYVPELGASAPAFGGGAMQVPDYGPQLVALIQTVIRPETWDVNGGPGSIYYWYPGRALVIRQMGEVHDQIGGVLGQLRRAGQ